MSFKYKWLHIPSGKSGESEINEFDAVLNRIHCHKSFLDALERWNNQQPGVWLYGPV